MKQLLRTAFCLLLGSALFACGPTKEPLTRQTLEAGFVTPPDSIQTSVYWYWMSNNLSKEGVVKDLQAMKKAGINRAFIGNIKDGRIPDGPVKVFSDEWWDILYTALKTAGELGIDIGIFNSPGWSQSGGPWVKPEQAMRYLASSETHVTGPQRLVAKLPQPNELFQDVKVIAYPAPKDAGVKMAARIVSQPQVAGIGNLTDGDATTSVVLPAAGSLTIDLTPPEPFTARALIVRPTIKPLEAACSLQVKEGDGYRTVSDFKIDRRSSESLTVGFDRAAPVVISIPATTASDFRLIVQNTGQESALNEIELSAAPRVERYSEKTLAKMYPAPLPYWQEYQWAAQPAVEDSALLISPASVVDISQYLASDGTLTWNVPEGEWVILRTGMTPTGTTNSPAPPEATGYETDKMSRPHIEAHFDNFIGQILERIPAKDRKAFKVVVEDSYETGGQNFTDDFLESFRKRYGYDPLPYLPAYYGYVVESPEASDRFLWDVRRLVADRVAYDYVAGLREKSHKYGLTTWLENYGHWGFPGEFLQYGGQSDEIGGEFWAEGDLGNIENRAAISCGHIYGKNKISAESFTSFQHEFERHPAVFKYRGDRFAAEGINNNLLHVCISQPYDSLPGINAWFGIEFNRGNTWFSQMDLFTTYLKRCNYMLQQGLNIADAAYFIGDDTPKMAGVLDPMIPAGYQYDFINAEVIERDMKVVDGLLTLPHGTQYRILVLPKLETMRPELLKKIKQLVADGGVVLGPPPTHSPSLQNQPAADAAVTEMAAELWGDVDGVKVKSAKYGKGMILNGLTMQEAFGLIECAPDCQLPEGVPVLYGHRQAGDIDIYFITNQSDKPLQVAPVFRVGGKQPELWLPTTGTTRKLPDFTQQEGTTTVPLNLDSYESVFVVFAEPVKAGKSPKVGSVTNYPSPALLTEISGPWNVSFDQKMRGPVNPVVMPRLQPWNEMPNDSVKYYSGTAVYTTGFDLVKLPANERILLDLGKLSAMGKVYVNGQYAGGVWTTPYELDITQWVKEGRNDLRVEVVNTWVNRLIGDSRLPASQRRTWTVVNPWRPDSPLQTSGLLGPVRVTAVAYEQ